MSLLLRRIWQFLQLMISNAKEPSKPKGCRSVSSPYPCISCLYYYYVLKPFLIGYLKTTSPCFNLYVFDDDWCRHFSSLYFLLSFPPLWMFCFYTKGLFDESTVLLLYGSNKLGHKLTGADPRTTSGIQTILKKQYLVLWLMKEPAIYLEINHLQMEFCQPMK